MPLSTPRFKDTGSAKRILRKSGWDIKNRDPSYHFQLIRKVGRGIAFITKRAKEEKKYVEKDPWETCDEWMARISLVGNALLEGKEEWEAYL